MPEFGSAQKETRPDASAKLRRTPTFARNTNGDLVDEGWVEVAGPGLDHTGNVDGGALLYEPLLK